MIPIRDINPTNRFAIITFTLIVLNIAVFVYELTLGKMGGEEVEAGGYWNELREQSAPFFSGARPLWRLSLPQTAAPIKTAHAQLVEWGGGVRWVSGDLDCVNIRTTVERIGGHATLFRGGDKSLGVFHPLQPALMKIHRRLKDAFDPADILNRGRMYDFQESGVR